MEARRESELLPVYAACTLCQDIWLRLTGSEPTPEKLIGSFEQALSDCCPDHTPLLAAFRDAIEKSELGDRCDDIGLVGSAPVSLTQSLSKGGLYWDLLLVNTGSANNSTGHGRILNPDWIDVSFVLECKKKCLQTHGRKCSNAMRLSPVTPMLLVDVQENCIVSGHDVGPYVALSYVWGTSGSTRRSNVPHGLLHKLKQPNALDSEEAMPYISPIIRRAMALTTLIGERWLWVDALCVPCGDFDATARQINMMGAIFGMAVVTIISADGNSENGLQGIEGASPSRKLDQRVIPFGRERIVIRNRHYFLEDGCIYNTRAWTYQEYKMSPRRIWFKDQIVSWECQCSSWDEELMPGSSFRVYIDPRPQTILAGIPDCESISHILSSYNERRLLFPEDNLSGIQGFLTVLSRAFKGGFLYGLPESHFDRFLGWRPCFGSTTLQRRVRSDRPNDVLLGPSELPSWSWVGWQGLIDAVARYDATSFNHRRSHIDETIPITAWYTSDSPTGHKRKIRPEFLNNIPKFKVPSNPLPPGWERFDAPRSSDSGELNIYPDGCGDHLYSHPNIMEIDKTARFYYPFPVIDITEDTPPCMPAQTAYLFCDTKRVWLYAKPQDNIELRDIVTKKFIMDLRDENGTVAGDLHLHNEEQLALIDGENAADKKSGGNKVELVAISKRRRYAKTWKEDLQQYDNNITIQNCYIVLWVEWVDGIAYRLASGSVREEIWEKLYVEDVSLILG